MNRVLEVHRIEPITDRVYGIPPARTWPDVYAFDEAPQAYERLATSNRVGKFVVRINRFGAITPRARWIVGDIQFGSVNGARRKEALA